MTEQQELEVLRRIVNSNSSGRGRLNAYHAISKQLAAGVTTHDEIISNAFISKQRVTETFKLHPELREHLAKNIEMVKRKATQAKLVKVAEVDKLVQQYGMTIEAALKKLGVSHCIYYKTKAAHRTGQTC